MDPVGSFLNFAVFFCFTTKPTPIMDEFSKQNVEKPKSHPVTPPSSNGLVDHFQF